MTEMNPDTPAEQAERKHFLPMDTNLFDRVFISIVLFVAINLLWMRFLETFLPLTVAALVSLVVAFFVITRG
jgi:predicted small integral membrane protein